MFALDTFNKKEQLLQLPTKCSCNNLQKCFATFCKKVLQKTDSHKTKFVFSKKSKPSRTYKFLYNVAFYVIHLFY